MLRYPVKSGAQIYAGHDQTTGEGMPEIVPSKIPDLGLGQRIFEPVASIL